MTEQNRLAEIEARVQAATPGPWSVIEWDVQRVVRAPTQFVCNTVHANDQDNAAFIAAARGDVEWLCEQVRRLEQERDAWEARFEATARTFDVHAHALRWQERDRLRGALGEVEE